MAGRGEQRGSGPPSALDENGWPILSDLSAAELRSGFALFFENKSDEALAFLSQHQEEPFFVASRAKLLFLRAVMSLEPREIAVAMEALQGCEAFLQTRLPRSSTLESLGRWVTGGGGKSRPSDAENHFLIMVAETRLVTAVLQLLQEGLYDKLKAALNIRNAWHIYVKLDKDVQAGTLTLTPEAMAGLRFGVGAFNLLCSCLPAKVLRVVSMFGFPSDRGLAFELLGEAFQSNLLITPVSALALLFHHVGLQAFFTNGQNYGYEDEARLLLDTCLERYHESFLFLLLKARLSRLLRSNQDAIDLLERAMRAQSTRVMKHAVHYELAWTLVFELQWEAALFHIETLWKHNDWSKLFFAYMCSVCNLKLGRIDKAEQMWVELSRLSTRKVAGRAIPVDEFIATRVKAYKSPQDLVFPDVEIVWLWNGFTQMSFERLGIVLEQLEGFDEAAAGGASEEQCALVLAMRGACLSQLQRFPEAEALLQQAVAAKKHFAKRSDLLGFARYELASVWYKQDGEWSERVASMMRKATDTPNSPLDARLATRIRMSENECQLRRRRASGSLTTEGAHSLAEDGPARSRASSCGSAGAPSISSFLSVLTDMAVGGEGARRPEADSGVDKTGSDGHRDGVDEQGAEDEETFLDAVDFADVRTVVESPRRRSSLL